MGTYNDENNGQNNAEDEMKQAIDTAKEAKKIADEAYRTAKKAGKLIGKISSVITFIITNFVTILQIIGISLIAIIAINCFQYIVELITAQNTPEQIYETLGVTDIKELVEIVGNESKGYHLEYVDDIDEKIDQIIDVLGSKSGVYTINSKDSDLIKKMIKAEVITQFPNLAGEYDEGNEEFQGAIKIRRITPNKEIGEMKNTGTGEVTTLGDKDQDAIIKEENVSEKEDRFFNSSGRETIGDENRLYVIAIAAGHNNTDDKGVTVSEEFVEEEMTIKVAEKVEEICQKYRNLIVVQTGSTSENPGGVSKEERVTLAKEADPDLCIQIHFNSGGGSGVEAYFEYGDGYSEALAQILSDQMAEKMGLENGGTKTNENNSDYYETIDSYYQTNFPSIITQGGFLDNESDQEVLRSDGIDKYAEAIVEGCIEYLRADHSDVSVTFVKSSTEASGIESRVYDLKYVPKAEFELFVAGNSKKALEYFTLDESFNVLTASWSVEGDKIEISTNSPYNLRSTLQNVTMPYEYLLYFLIDSGNKEFVRDLADLVADTEIIMAVQDNITTTEIKAIVQQRTNASVDEKDTDWKEVPARSKEESSFIETCRTSVSITYADTWFVRYSREGDSYSSNSLGIKKDELVDKTVSVRGKVTEQTSSEEKEPYTIGERKSGSYEILVPVDQEDDEQESSGTASGYLTGDQNQNNSVSNYDRQDTIAKTIKYTYIDEEKYEKTIHTISNSYEEGEAVVEENINKFCNLYTTYKMANCVKEEWLFKILAGNTKTANMVDLTKYLIYKATGTSYGIEEFDFSEYDLKSFSGMTGIYGNTIQEKVWFALRNLGYSEIAVAGAMGNIHYESGSFDPTAIEGGYTEFNGGIGLCQWTNNKRGMTGRNTNLRNFATSRGTVWQDEDIQIEYLIGELTIGGGADGYASYNLMNSQGYTPSQWIDATDIDTATRAFAATFERPSASALANSIEKRISYAEMYYNEFKGKTAPSGDSRIGTITLSGDNASIMMEMLMEALRIADDDRYTYSQANRYGEYQYDCSSLVSRLYKEYFNFDAPSTTRGYGSAYHIGKEGSVELQPGDVLWKQGHVEIYIGNGLVVGAHTDQCAIPDQISVESYIKGYFTDVYRFIQ